MIKEYKMGQRVYAHGGAIFNGGLCGRVTKITPKQVTMKVYGMFFPKHYGTRFADRTKGYYQVRRRDQTWQRENMIGREMTFWRDTDRGNVQTPNYGNWWIRALVDEPVTESWR